MEYLPGALGVFGFLFIILAIVLAILWIILPFAVFGIKGKLDVITDLMRDLRNEIREMNVKIDRN